MKALIAMSGGVDSSMAALLTQKEGFECIGCTMKLFENRDARLEARRTCCSLDDVEDARRVAMRKGIRLSGLLEGGAQERGLRAGTENVPGIAAMAVALQETAAAMPAVIPALSAKRDRLIRGLLEIPDTVLNGDPHSRLPGNVNVSFAGISAEPLLLLLDQKGIQASSGSACTSGALDPSHVLLALGRSGDEARGSLRLTLGEDISDRDVGQIITAVSETVQHLRQFHF